MKTWLSSSSCYEYSAATTWSFSLRLSSLYLTSYNLSITAVKWSMFNITIIPLIHYIHIKIHTIPRLTTLVCCWWFQFSQSLWFCRYLDIIILMWMVGIIWPIWTIGGFFHMVMVVYDIHGVCYLLNDSQWQSIHPHWFDILLKNPHGHIILQLVSFKNNHSHIIGGMLGDGRFIIVLQNGQLEVFNRSRL